MKKLLIISSLILSTGLSQAQGTFTLNVLTQLAAGSVHNTGVQHVMVTATVTGARIPATGNGSWGSATLFLRLPKSLTPTPVSTVTYDCGTGAITATPSSQITNFSNAGFPDLAFDDVNASGPSFEEGSSFSCVPLTNDGFVYIPLKNTNSASNKNYPLGATYTLFEFDVPNSWVCSNCMTIVPSNPTLGTLFDLGLAAQPNMSFIPPIGGGLPYNTAVVGQNNQPLPITLVDFNAVKADEYSSRITWETSSEVNSDYFEVERSADAKNFTTTISHMKAAGQSATTLDYVTYDRAPLSGDNYYRLKMVGIDGSIQYSGTKKVTFDNLVKEGVSLTTNPVSPSTKLRVVSYVDQRLDYIITDVAGKMITGGSVDVTKGTGTYTIDNMSALANGTYYLTAKGATINSTLKISKID